MSVAEPIQFFNRYTQKIELEAVYGDAFLKWAYGNPLGRLTTELAVKRAWFSHWYGWRMDQPKSRGKVLPFIEQFQLSVDEFADSPDDYKTFNDFFYRKLKPSARPVAEGETTAVFPADGRHLGFANLSEAQRIFAKGQSFDLPRLLGSEALAKEFTGGALVFSRLCPVDYHRFHFPVSGEVNTPELLNGVLYSVNPIALRQNIAILWENKRFLTRMESPLFGTVLLIELGATCVGSVVHTQPSGGTVHKGDEKGYFRFGGSSFITLFQPGRIQLADDLLANTEDGRELYARMGDAMGEAMQ